MSVLFFARILIFIALICIWILSTIIAANKELNSVLCLCRIYLVEETDGYAALSRKLQFGVTDGSVVIVNVTNGFLLPLTEFRGSPTLYVEAPWLMR